MADVYRQVYTAFWQDTFVLSLTPEEKYFYLYLITNSKSNFCGIYELPLKVAEFETGYNRETIEKLIKKFEEYGKIKYSDITNEICVCNFVKYNANRSPKVQSAVNKGIDSVKDKKLIPYIYGIDRVSSETETETETETEEKNKKPTRHKYGEYSHVLLTDEQYQKLIDDYGVDKVNKYIKKVDEYCQQYGKSYKDYNLTIRNWLNKDNAFKPKENKTEVKRDYEIKVDKDGGIFWWKISQKAQWVF